MIINTEDIISIAGYAAKVHKERAYIYAMIKAQRLTILLIDGKKFLNKNAIILPAKNEVGRPKAK